MSEKRKAEFWVGYYKLLLWMEARRWWIRLTFWTSLIGGLALTFVFPIVGVIVVFAVMLPVFLAVIAAGLLDIKEDIKELRHRSRNRS